MVDDIATIWGGSPRIGRRTANGELLIGNGKDFNLNTLIAGAGISISTLPAGSITISATGPGFNVFYGAFESHQNQLVAGAGVTTLVSYNVTSLSNGVSVASGTRITVANPGVYNLQFSLQVVAAINNTQAWFWLKKNGADVPYSNTEVDFPSKDHGYVAAWNFLEDLAAGDYLELAWTASDAGTLLKDGAATYGPNIPSAIATMVMVK